MKRFTFRGGIHPYEGKELSKDSPIREVLPGDELVYFLSQHIGAPAVPCVKPGDRVLVGQMIAESGGFVSAPVHSSVSGTVKKMDKRRNTIGDYLDCIVVENDHQYETVGFEPLESLEGVDRKTVIGRIKDGGIVGMGGAGFPTHVKLSPKDPSKIDHIIVNGSECEPYLTSDYRRMLENPEWVVKGLQCILHLFPHANGYICVEDNKLDCAAKLEEAAKDDPRISVRIMKTKYPEGAERCMIYALTGREVNSASLPADFGCIVDNVDTVTAIYRAVMLGIPCYSRVVTVTGDAVKEPGNFEVRTGTDQQELIDAAGGFIAQPEKIISGGPMMGFALYDTHVPVTKTSSAVTCFLKDPVSSVTESACISCGRCLTACPEHLVPCRLADYAIHGNEEAFLAYDGMECVECGSCSWTCPAKRPLAANIKTMRRSILANRRKR